MSDPAPVRLEQAVTVLLVDDQRLLREGLPPLVPLLDMEAAGPGLKCRPHSRATGPGIIGRRG